MSKITQKMMVVRADRDTLLGLIGPELLVIKASHVGLPASKSLTGQCGAPVEYRKSLERPLTRILVADDLVLLKLAPAQMIQGTPHTLTGAVAGQRRAWR
jgi:hypothetical protein